MTQPFTAVGNRLQLTLLRFPCPQKILMVADSALDFSTDGFGLSEFTQIVRDAGHSVDTAHRNGIGPTTKPGTFAFSDASLAGYDQVWLFGFSTQPLQPGEQTAVAAFMQRGGGVFATGDHSAIGAGMGAALPRVRRMRNWATIEMSGPARHDTVVDPGADATKQFDDQADAIAQRIYPVFLSNGGDPFQKATWSPHPLLRHSSGAVDALPDHPHESECLAPAAVPGTFAGVEEWPAAPGGARPAAQVVARSISGGRFIEDVVKPPVVPRCFGAISAYDGDAADVGRIVCDATWHHFVNVNLNGAGTSPARSGLYAAGQPTPEYLKIQQYYRNTARWLAPKRRRACWPWLQLAVARFDFELIEELRPHPHPCPWDPMLYMGTLVEGVLTRQHGPGVADEIVAELLDAAGASPALRAFFTLRTPEELSASPQGRTLLFPRETARRAVLGSLTNVLLHELPNDQEQLAAAVRDHDRLALKTTAAGVHAAEAAIVTHLREALAATGELVDRCATAQRSAA